MKRRDFLRFRSSGGQRIVYLSCQRLYMNLCDVRTGREAAVAAMDAGTEDEWWTGEPPAVVESGSVEQLWNDVAAEIEAADVLVLEAREWLQGNELSARLEQLLSTYRETGGEVRIALDQAGRHGTAHAHGR